jgi:hypothetical protein
MTVMEPVVMQCMGIVKHSLVQCFAITWVWVAKGGKDMGGQ